MKIAQEIKDQITYHTESMSTDSFAFYTDNGWCSSRMYLRHFDTFDHACQFATKLADDLPAHHCISIYSAQNQKMTTIYGQR